MCVVWVGETDFSNPHPPYTHRTQLGRRDGPAASSAPGHIPMNLFVCGLLKVDSQPHKRAPVLHNVSGLRQISLTSRLFRLARAYPAPTLYVARLPGTHCVATRYQIWGYPALVAPTLYLPCNFALTLHPYTGLNQLTLQKPACRTSLASLVICYRVAHDALVT